MLDSGGNAWFVDAGGVGGAAGGLPSFVDAGGIPWLVDASGIPSFVDTSLLHPTKLTANNSATKCHKVHTLYRILRIRAKFVQCSRPARPQTKSERREQFCTQIGQYSRSDDHGGLHRGGRATVPIILTAISDWSLPAHNSR